MNTKRFFLAIPVPEAIRKSLSLYSSVFTSDALRLVKPENYHITVSFFGEQEEKNFPIIRDVITAKTRETQPFPLHYHAITLAPPKKTPSMIWAQYHSSDAFTEMVSTIEAGIRLSLPYSDRREGSTPIPHITLARFRGNAVPELPMIELDPVHVTSLSLFVSERLENNPVYHELETFTLL
jgi:RNA 2',3'-cyclic 3'-phosphodiesterase